MTALAAVASMAALAAQTGAPVENGPLARIVAIAFATGFGGPLSGKICTSLGVTVNKEVLPVEQLSAASGGNSRSFNVSRHRGHLDVIISLKTKEETTVFLMSAQGDLEKTVQEKPGEQLREVPPADAMAAFQREKSWWLDTWLKLHDTGPGRK